MTTDTFKSTWTANASFENVLSCSLHKKKDSKEHANIKITFHDTDHIHKHFTHCVCNKYFTQIEQEKYLGIYIYEKMKFEKHINYFFTRET